MWAEKEPDVLIVIARLILIRPIRQCCGVQCNDGKLCEQRALKEYRERQGTTWIDIIKHPLFIFGIAYIIGYLVGRG